MSADYDREQRLRDGCCPNCGTRLYKVTISGGGVMSKMFKKKNNVADRNTVTSESIKMTPLTIPGAVERGQCIMCVTGITPRRVDGRGEGRAVYANASLVPTVKAVPVFASIPPSTPPTPYARAPPQPITQTKSNDRILGDTGKINRGNLKQPPEKLLSLYDNRAAASGNLRSSIDSEEDEDGSSGSSEYDDSSCEDYPLLDMYLCSLESEAASSVVNNLRNERSEDVDGMDDRKPPATPRLSNERAPPEFSECTKKSSRKGTQKLECPLGMSPEVFYELPIEMQKEVASSRSNGASQSSAGDIDPDVLLSLPEQIRREILEQATQEQPSEDKPRRTSLVSLARLSRSQTSFLSECNIDANDFNNLPEDVKNDIMGEKSRTRGKASELIQESKSQDESVYDPESLANLPEEVRNEVLDDERRQREQQRHKNNAPKSAVGAHRVDIPAGYDPETFSALPEDMQQELRNDATQQRRERGYSADGYDYASIIGARVVPTHPMGSVGTAELCTYEGERNDLGKRHGDGVLKWANGDEYVGKFKDGYIEGRGTISFHDGTEYAGQWKKNRFHGEGTRRFNNGNVYTGHYESGKRQGLGRCYFANGDQYVGDWKKDTIHGFGRYYYNNGHSFEGMFRDGKRNGRGKYQLADGRVEIYRYHNDSRVSSGVRWSANRKKAWLMKDGKAIKRITFSEAVAIAKTCGPVVEES